MMEETGKGHSYNYFCTVGSGLEKFCAKELTDLTSTLLEITVGKVFFSSCLSIKELLSLKTAERLFLLVHKGPQFLLSHPKRKSIQLLRDLVEESRTYSNWESCLKKWREFHITDVCNISNVERLTFRVSCKCSGKIKHAYPPTFLGKILAGSLLNTHQKWTTNLRHPQLEVLANASMDTFTIGLACCPMNNPLSKRSYLPSIGSHTLLRPTVCFAMLDIAMSNSKVKLRSCEVNSPHKLENIKSGPLVILDPMCGTGIILAEAAVSLDLEEGMILYGSDYDISKLSEASNNILSARNHKQVTTCSIMYKTQGGSRLTSDLFVSDARALPLMDSSVDCIISDIPFGLKHQGIPWKRDIIDPAKVTILEDNKLSLVEQQKIVHNESYNLGVNGEYDQMTNIKVADTQNTKIEPLLDIGLDATVESEPMKSEMMTTDSIPKLNATGEGSKRKNLTSHGTFKMRKTEHTKCIKGSTAVNDVKNMFPLILTEMDRVLRKDGQAVLLISETLKSALLETVNTVTNSKCSYKYLCKYSNSENFSSISLEKDNSKCLDNLDQSKKDQQREESLTEMPLQKEGSWTCIGQHQVKLGLLDAVICVFNK